MCCTALGTGINSVMNNVASLVRTLPCHRHVVVVTFVLRRHQTNIHIEIQELEGGVRATSLLCLLGISVGIGSIFIYRLYTRLFSSSLASAPKRKRHVSDICSAKSCASEKSNVVTPDSGIVPDSSSPVNFTNDCAKHAADLVHAHQHISSSVRIRKRFSDLADLNRRHSCSGSIDDILVLNGSADVHCPVRRSMAVADWLARTNLDNDDTSTCTSEIFADRKHLHGSSLSQSSSADHGFASGWMTESAEFNSLDIPRPIARTAVDCDPWRRSADGGCNSVVAVGGHSAAGRLRLDLYETTQQLLDFGVQLAVRKRGLSESGVDDGGPWNRRRRRFSLASGASASDCDYRESLVSKGFSIDLGEDLDGMLSPPIGNSTVDLNTVAGMESLQNALRCIQQDIEDMNEKFDGLRSVMVPNVVNLQLNPNVEWSVGDDMSEYSISRSGSHVDFRSSSEREVDGESNCGVHDLCEMATDLIWDYRSDLVHSSCIADHGFVVQRPLIGQSCDNNCNFSSGASASSLPRTESDVGSVCGHDGGMDMYIDDDFGVVSTTASVPQGRLPYEKRCQWTIDETDTFSCGSSLSAAMSSPAVESPARVCSSCSYQLVSSASFELPHVDACGHEFQCSTSHSLHHSSRRSSASTRSQRRCQRPSCCRNEQDQLLVNASNGKSGQCRRCFVSSASCERISCSPVETGYCRQNYSAVQGAVHPFQCDQLNNYTAGHRQLCYGGQFGDGSHMVGELKDICKVLDADLSATQRSHTAKKNCQEVIRMWGVLSVRSVGNDSYSAIRAVLYAALLDNQPILSRCGNLNDCCQRIISYSESQHKYLRSWNFAAAESLCLENAVVDKLLECIRCLFEQVDIVDKLSSRQQRDQYLSAMLNGNPHVDRRMIEATKILMVLGAISTCDDLASSGQVQTRFPIFICQMFGRSSSVTAETFFHNHINCIEDAPALCIQPLELAFLSYTLGVRLQVFHASRSAKCDYLRHYPDEGADHLPVIRLLESDGQGFYYVPV